MAKRYGQYCAVAHALDVVGDRWSLLIVRELALRRCRFRDLQDGLPGIATNLLAGRLRDLAAAGVIERTSADPPTYGLTQWGSELWPILVALARWAGPTMLASPGTDAFRSRWLHLVIEATMGDVATADLAPLRVRVDTGDEPVDLVVGRHGVRAEAPSDDAVDVTLAATTEDVVALLCGFVELGSARRIDGSAEAIDRFVRLTERVGGQLGTATSPIDVATVT